MKVKCPRCGHILTAYPGESDAECWRCSQVCEEGAEYGDCTLIDARAASAPGWKGTFNWPQGMHLGRSKADDKVPNRVWYCTTHGHFVDKVPVLVPVPWQKYQTRRLPKQLRIDRHV